MSSREEILNAVRNKGQKIAGVNGAKTIDPVSHINNHESGDIVAEFVARATENKAIVVESTREKLSEEINVIIAKEGVSNLIYPAGLPIDAEGLQIGAKFKFDQAIDGFKSQIFDYDVSIVNACHAISSHGVCCIASSKEQPRLLSLTPKLCIMLLEKSKIEKSIASALNKIKEENGGRLPTNVVFISGPSRTSDIELVPVLGVHGSQIAYVIVY